MTKSVLRAGARIDLSNRELARVLGLSQATVSRLNSGAYVLSPNRKPYELGLLFVRLYCSLDSIVGGDAAVARAWLHAESSALGGVPLARIMTIAGLAEVIAYLDGRRALV